MHFLLNHPAFSDLAAAVEYYFTDGRRSAARLAALIAELGIGRRGSIALLERASGCGCVTRHLPDALSAASVTACDIHPQAVAFIEQELGTPALLSDRVPEQLQLPRRNDVVFVLSFYSHMPRETWSRWIRARVRLLEPDGVLIFTTHGQRSLPHLGSPEVPADGFWFAPRSEQPDLPTPTTARRWSRVRASCGRSRPPPAARSIGMWKPSGGSIRICMRSGAAAAASTPREFFEPLKSSPPPIGQR